MNLPLQETTATGGKTYTYADYRQLPEGAPYQLIGGELVLTPAPSTYHQIIAFNIGLQLGNFVMHNQRGKVLFAPVDVYLSETETYQPDIIFIAQERLRIIEPERINGAPDLVVEILSPATAYYDLRKKFKVYERCGVKEYWIVDPGEKSAQLFTLKEGRFVLDQEAEGKGEIASRVLEGFTVTLASIFEG
ncbi:Uma2 family endonuclease [Thermodesulfitimonas autotrophica]|uniref:Uma2 family endonuclease n=1 Tax=Thermodesulfitimonas autotrophica TaxID=1894989 RepID=A0A3N5BBF8_9THEO|nr:Uma2 family endonuclease [Thermodesulfitimonas autotrophica]RPF47008.1 Uma2 family endonuclease [Thermodesulfitimonas autotrophica]